MRALVIGALALSLVGCSRQPPPPASITSCGDANGAPCLGNRAVGRPVALAPSRAALAARAHKSSLAAKTKRPSLAHARAKVRLAAKAAKSTTVGARAEPPAPRIPLPPPAPRPPPQFAKSAADGAASRVDVADAHPTEASSQNSEQRTIQEQIAVAAAAAERLTAAPAAQPKTNKDRPEPAQNTAWGEADRAAATSPNSTDLMVAVLMARPDVKSVSDLAGKTIAIDERYAKSSGTVRTAIVAAGGTEVQLSEGQSTAINRLTNGEVPAAVVALVFPDAAETFPDIKGFKVFHVPLSPRSAKARP